MGRSLFLGWFLFCPALLAAAEKPALLTENDIRAGWLLLFDGETAFGWKSEGEVKVVDGALQLGGEKAASLTTTSRFGKAEIAIQIESGSGSLGYQGATIELARQGKAPGSETLRITPQTKGDRHSLQLSTTVDDQVVPVGFLRFVEIEKPTLSPLTIATLPGKPIVLRSLKLRPLGTEPLFNGKDLTGWKVFPGAKYQSKFTVTPEGWLNVRNGPGDLQTEKQWADFILQTECYINGKALNSGFFFRCIADQYQNGYEVQIQNGFKGDDRTKPFDFGTGAIYRRVQARKIVANDKEWFTMTVLADGKHLATWVNGYPTVDWFDDRKDHDNPRQGCKTGKGHISIQGHDPTTDLNFRNIRLVELGGK